MSHSIDIGICTFRRPQLAEVLHSLTEMDLPERLVIRVIVADNDDTPSARDIAQAVRMPFELVYVHAPGRNISIARNAVLEAAQADYLAFIDDDETADPAWLTSLYDEAQKSGADVVFGPVVARYPPEAPAWMVTGDYHSVSLSDTPEEAQTGATCNVFIDRRSVAFQDQWFDLDLGKSGGEDTVFFRRISHRGGRMRVAPAARVYEKVAPGRLSLKWLIERKVRSGQSHAESLFQVFGNQWRTRVRLILSAGGKALFCAGFYAVNVFRTERRNYWLLRGSLHAGVMSKCFGRKEKVLYGKAP